MCATYIHCGAERHLGRESQGVLKLASLPACREELLARYAGTVQTMYLDPPFNTGKRFEMKARIGEKGYRDGTPALTLPAYDDRWESREEYLAMMRDTLVLARDLMRKEGTIFVHIDCRMHAHIRLLMDEIFGESNFLNEIIWSYQSGGRARTYFPRKHDVILFYAKSRSYYFSLKSVPIARGEARSNHMKRSVDEDGRVYRSIISAGKEYRYYDDEPAYPGDVWDDVSHLQQKDPQRTGYDTQKPVKLLERIISCSSQEGDLVCDLFCGSGTTAVAAAKLGRQFLCVDQSPLAIAVAGKRLSQTATGKPMDVCYDVEAACGEDDCFVEAEVFPAITSYTVHLKSFDCVAAREAGIAGMDAVDQWSAGFVQGGTYRSCVESVRTVGTPALATAMEMPVCAGEPCIMIVDIWGNRRFYLPKRRY